MDFETIRYDVSAGVAQVMINRPAQRNCLNAQTALELRKAVQFAGSDPKVAVLVLTGAGTVFCAGGDVSGVSTEMTPQAAAAREQRGLALLRDAINPLVSTIYHLDKPVIAAVNGPVAGGGVGLALAADIVVATESARFMLKFTPMMALTPDMGCSWIMPRLIGRARSLGLMLLDEPLTARDAQSWGLIWRCYPEDQFIAEVAALAARLAAGPKLAQAGVKQSMRATWQNDYDQQLHLEAECSARCCGSDDYREAVTAFREKREPNFSDSGTSFNDSEIVR